jgi:hypothetical protein
MVTKASVGVAASIFMVQLYIICRWKQWAPPKRWEASARIQEAIIYKITV